jgi:anti-sigma factor RsiW
MRDDDITCRELVELLTDYLEGAIPPADRARIDAHLAVCDGCTTALEELRIAIRVTGSLTEDHVPEAQREALREAFRAWRSDPSGAPPAGAR